MPSRSLGHRAPLLWLVLPLIAGLAVGQLYEWPVRWWLLGGALVAAVGANLAAWRGARWWAPALLTAMFLAGVASYSLHRARLPSWDYLPSREVRVLLRIDRVFASTDPRRASGRATIERAEAHVHELVGQPVYYSLGVRPGQGAPARSSVLSVAGVLAAVPRHPPADSFDGYLASAGMNFRLTRGQVLAVEQPPTRYYAFLERAATRLNQLLSAGVEKKRPALTAIYRAMMLGQKHELSVEQDALFMESGTMHLFAINGLHIGVVALALHALLAVARCTRPLAAAITLGVLWLDVDTTGASPSAVRAFLLVACFESAFVLRRPANGLAAVAAAALIILLVTPMALFSASFQMSYSAVLAILCLGLPLAERLQEHFAPFRAVPEATWRWWQRAVAWVMRWFWPVLGIGIAAALVSAVTGPEFFHTWAPGGLGANLVLVPLASLVIVAGFASVVAGLAGVSFLGILFNHAAIVVLLVIDRLIRLGVGVRGVWWTAHWRPPWLASVTLALLVAAMLFGYATGWRKQRGGWWPPFVIAALGLILGVKFG